ncbi:hypothetical protein VOLCADRAFT_121354 [Volvox carteri f. nagariensis]|uniref:C-CAP/cofactor C-like domain-containing protein n=1 Tax=Volvox carteri f. nagariensis TaxID=3068 RepID=D8U876_VOLCA|nr:uncharacterized protein VOLCADRAFT_121354 [Volvox carteri f. nagariensis]EFJ44041.1 hypothetical protein VOLCADRAFT_121354 [Volvox carteri f. nagariensis]|eukprot:XP_002954842.1 hypothetical protein VOLCADRAFT_121354 [Volvox carteri f. nagariensis]
MQPRREVWEYGSIPLQSLCPQLDGVQSLLSFHGKLFARSKTGRHGQRIVTPADVAQTLELTTHQQAQPQPPPQLGQEDIYLHELSLYLLAQLFCKESQRADAVEYWPDPNSTSFAAAVAAGGGVGGFGAGQELLSPTRRSQPGGRSLLRQQLQGHLRAQIMAMRGFGDYLRRNLKPAVELVLESWPPQPGALVSERELDRLAFVLGCTTGGPRGALEPEPISAAVAAAHNGTTGGPAAPGNPPYTPLPVESAVAALRQLWQEECVDSPRLLALSTSSISSASSPSPKFQRSMGMVDDRAIAGVYRGTVVRGEGDLPLGDVRITDCHEAVIYLLAPLQAAFISGCSDCTIVVGAVGRLLRVERCDKVQVIAATNRLLVASCHECCFNVGTPRGPVLHHHRDARDLHLHLHTPRTGKDRKSLAGSTPNSPRLASSGSGSAAYSSSVAKSSFSLQSPDEFLPFVVPFLGSNGPLAGGAAPAIASRWNHLAVSAQRGPGPLYLFPLPAEYERALQRRLNLTHDMRSKFKQAGLTKDKERELNDAIQSYFKEWLVGSNLLRQIYDLSTLEKEEMAAAAAASASASAVGLSPIPGPAGLADAR